MTGGRGSENGVSKDVWIYDTVHEEWSKGAPMLIARYAVCCFIGNAGSEQTAM